MKYNKIHLNILKNVVIFEWYRPDGNTNIHFDWRTEWHKPREKNPLQKWWDDNEVTDKIHIEISYWNVISGKLKVSDIATALHPGIVLFFNKTYLYCYKVVND